MQMNQMDAVKHHSLEKKLSKVINWFLEKAGKALIDLEVFFCLSLIH